MMLWEEGKFKLDDPISKFIPEFKNQQVLKSFQYSDTTWTGEKVKSEITIRHLLSHTSGIGYGFIDADERLNDPSVVDDAVNGTVRTEVTLD